MTCSSVSALYYAIFKAVLTELSANDVNCILVDRQRLGLSKHIYL